MIPVVTPKEMNDIDKKAPESIEDLIEDIENSLA